MKKVRIAMNGALGRMGQRILHLAHQSSDVEVACAFEHDRHPALGSDLAAAIGLAGSKRRVEKLTPKALAAADVLIDFSSPDGTLKALAAAVEAGKGVVVGTTGLDAAAEARVREASKSVAVLYSPNMSIGANLLFELAKTAAAKLGAGYDIEIVEAHHRHKKDAPSGTAKRLAEKVCEGRGWDLKKVARYGREGFTGERPKDQLGIHVIRAGEIVGDHTASFSGPGETLELTHRAQSRDAFARGALVAAVFVAGKKKGLFGMADVLR